MNKTGSLVSVKFVKRGVVILAVVASAFPAERQASAANPSGIYTVVGPGNNSCGSWMADRPYNPGTEAFTASQHTTNILRDEALVDGYVTSFNAKDWKGKNVASETDVEGMYAWIDKYCANNPTDNIAGATEALVAFLSKGPHPNSK